MNDDQQPEFRSLTEFDIVIFLNHLRIVENPPKERENLKIRMAMANAMEPFRDSYSPSWFSGFRLNLPLIGLVHDKQIMGHQRQ